MKTETWSPEETFQLGKRLGEQAQPGQIYTAAIWASEKLYLQKE